MNEEKKPLYKNPWLYVYLISLFAVMSLMAQLLRLRIFPTKYQAPVNVVLLLIHGLAGYMLMSKHDSKVKRIFGCLIAACLTFTSLFGSYYINDVISAIKAMNAGEDQIRKTSSIYAVKFSPVNQIKDLEGRTIGILSNISREGTDQVISELTNRSLKFNIVQYESSIAMMNDFKGQAIDCVIIDDAYLSVISDYEGYENIESTIKKVYTYEYYIDKVDTISSVDVTENPFTVLISGIDTYGEISETSRSDVNILVSVNPKTKNVVIASIPRDYYVEMVCDAATGCPNGQKDKLTHAGLYGVEATEQTIENMLGVEINYNAKINFSSLETIVDSLGGVTVQNDNKFTAGGYTFEAGTLNLNGPQALAYSRERKSFLAGDRTRGQNQMRVIRGIIDKLLSPAILNDFSGLMSSISSTIQTNMTYEEMTSLVNMQLSDGASWRIFTLSLNGSDGNEFSPSIGDNAYVMYPDENTMVPVRNDIQAIMNGDKPAYGTESKTS